MVSHKVYVRNFGEQIRIIHVSLSHKYYFSNKNKHFEEINANRDHIEILLHITNNTVFSYSILLPALIQLDTSTRLYSIAIVL